MEKIYQFVSEYPRLVFGTTAAVMFGTSLALRSSPETQQRVDFSCQSIQLEGPEGIRVSTLNDVTNGEYFRKYDEFNNLYESFLAGEKLSNNGPCMGHRPPGSKEYVWKTYSEIREQAQRFGSGLIQKGFKGGGTSYLGIYSINREEWAVTDIACTAYNITTIPLYDTLGETSTKYIINLVGIPVIVCDTFQKVHRLLDQKPELKTMKLIIVAENEIPENILSKARAVGVDLTTYNEIVELGKQHLQEPTPAGTDDLYTICFTSGTTGDPKGVMLTHGNQLCMAGSVNAVGISFNNQDTHFSYLPLAHSFERTMLWVSLACGTKYGFYSGDARKIVEDATILKPTIFVGVPRVLNRIYDKATSAVNEASFVKRMVFNLAFSSKRAAVLKGVVTKDSIWDKLVFKKIQDLLGGCVRLMISGGAPASPEVLIFMRMVFGVTVIEAYGQTECTAAATVTIAGDNEAGHVGPPIPCCMVKLVDVPEKDYYAKDGEGEVCFKGSNVFQGYFKKPDLTAEVLDQDGWLHSGDIGLWQANGTLKIIDRKKHIFKLSHGEYISPEKLENIYVSCPLIAQVFVYGNSNQQIKYTTLGVSQLK